MSDFATHIQRMAGYNAWANQTLLTAAESLTEDQMWQDRGAFFGSVMGTLNHVLVGDRIWFARMTNQSYDWFTGLDQCLHRSYEAFKKERQAVDRFIQETVPHLPTEGTLSYRDSQGNPQEKPWAVVLPHVFNHQTHHRAQVHTLLGQFGVSPPPLDYLYYTP